MSRLAHHLRYFELPPTASTADLRREYLRRVKQLHPDVGKSTPDEFLRLRQNFDAASELLGARPADAPDAARGGCGAAAWPAGAGPPRPSWAPPKCPRAWATVSPEAQRVPVVGLPTGVVYPATAVSLFAAAALPFAMVFVQEPQAPPRREATVRHTAPGGRAAALGAPRERAEGPPRPALEPGPWSVPASIAAGGGTALEEAAEGRARAGIRLLRDGGESRSPLQARRRRPRQPSGAPPLAARAAAQAGRVWWLERCGAAPECRGLLDGRDAAGDTLLHYAARAGTATACAALLRLGADPTARNDAGQLPGEAAEAGGHAEAASLLRGALEGAGLAAQRHPDGLGVLTEPPPGVTFTGLQETDSLRRALNMAASCRMAPPLPITRAAQEADGTGERAVNVVCGSLQGTEFDVEDLSGRADPWLAGPDQVEVCGLLLYEPAGSVSPDAPGHWVAVKRRDLDAGEVPDAQEFWRLDPVRGSFRMSPEELGPLLARYRAWRVVRGPPGLGAARTAKASAAAAALRTQVAAPVLASAQLEMVAMQG